MRKIIFIFLFFCAKGFPEPLLHYIPQITNESYFYADGEFLYWTPEVANLSFAFRSDNLPGGATEITRLFSVDYDWHPGFRVQGSYKFQDYWDLSATYTYFRSHGRDSVTSEPNAAIVDAFSPNIGSIANGTSEVELSYNILNLDLGRKHISQQNLLLRFITGAVIAWIDQKWNNSFSVNNALNNPGSVNYQWDFLGGGIRLCAEGDFKVWKGFSFIGNVSLASVFSRTKNRIFMQFGPTISANDADLKFNSYKINPMMGMALGLQWSTASDASCVFQVSTGYELVYWWDVYEQLLRRDETASFDNILSGPLSLQGLFARAGIYF